MNNKTNIRLVYTHPKSNRSTDNLDDQALHHHVIRDQSKMLSLLDNHQWPTESEPFVVWNRSDQRDKIAL